MIQRNMRRSLRLRVADFAVGPALYQLQIVIAEILPEEFLDRHARIAIFKNGKLLRRLGDGRILGR